MCDMNWVTWETTTYSYMRHGIHSFTCVIWLIHREAKHSRTHMWEIKTSTRSFICVTWIVRHEKHSLIHMCNMALTHSYVWHDSVTVKNKTHICNSEARKKFWCFFFYYIQNKTTLKSPYYIQNKTTLKPPLPTCEWVTAQISLRHFTYFNEACHIYGWVMSHTSMSHVTYMNVSCHVCTWVCVREREGEWVCVLPVQTHKYLHTTTHSLYVSLGGGGVPDIQTNPWAHKQRESAH